MKRILFIMGDMGLGGAETHIMKVYREINKEEFQFDFVLTCSYISHYENEIFLLGGKIFRITPKKSNLIKSILELSHVVSSNKYSTVFKCGEHAMSWTDMFAAKLGGANIRIMRSTNSSISSSLVSRSLHFLSRPLLNHYCTIKIAPSRIAGDWLFGKEKREEILIIKNGISVENFEINVVSRDKIRKNLSIENKIVLGHVGRFAYQKNHTFLIDIFNSYHNKNPLSVLLLIGDGDLKNEIVDKVNSLGIQNDVLFLGNIDNIYEYYSVMDYLIFPSLYEGMPNTVIEAQASGLKCFVSDFITKEVDILGDIEFLPLDNINSWIEAIPTLIPKRDKVKKKFVSSGYAIEDVVKKYMEVFN